MNLKRKNTKVLSYVESNKSFVIFLTGRKYRDFEPLQRHVPVQLLEDN